MYYAGGQTELSVSRGYRRRILRFVVRHLSRLFAFALLIANLSLPTLFILGEARYAQFSPGPFSSSVTTPEEVRWGETIPVGLSAELLRPVRVRALLNEGVFYEGELRPGRGITTGVLASTIGYNLIRVEMVDPLTMQEVVVERPLFVLP